MTSMQHANAEMLVNTILSVEQPAYDETTPILAYSIHSLGNTLSQIEEQLMPQMLSHKQGKAYEDNLKLLRLVLLNLIAVGFSHEQLTIQSTPRKGTYLNIKFGFNQRKVKRIIKAVTEAGYAEKVFYGSQSAKLAGAYRPTAELLRPYCNFLYSHEGDFDDYAPVRLDKEPHHGEIAWYNNLERDRHILTTYNEFMRQFSWARKDVTHRSFNSEPYKAGRVHTPFQTIVNRRVPIRKQTLLNGKPIAEPDFSANHLTLLAMIFNETLPESPYDRVADDTRIKKSIVKEVLVRLMGASGKQSYVQAQRTLETRRRDPVARTKTEAIRQSFYKCIPFLKKHDLLCAGMGAKLQFLEGEIAMQMFEWAVDTQTTIINVHDAYACEQDKEGEVEEAMHRMRDKILTNNKLLSECGMKRE